MAEEFLPAEQPGDLGYSFLLHRGTRAAAVERMVVGVDPHGERVSGARYRMWRLDHLAGVEGMEVRKVIAKTFGGFAQDGIHAIQRRRGGGEFRQRAEACVEMAKSGGDRFKR